MRRVLPLVLLATACRGDEDDGPAATDGSTSTAPTSASGGSSLSSNADASSGASTTSLSTTDSGSSDESSSSGGSEPAEGCAALPSRVEPDRARYVRAGAMGDATGADWTHAFAQLPDALERGATYFVAAGDYPDYTFDDPADGETPIVVRRASCSDHGTDAGWEPALCEDVARFGSLTIATDAIVFDGVEGGGPGSWEAGFGFSIRSGGHNVHFEGPRRDVVIAHIDIENNGRYSTESPGNEHTIYGIGGISNIRIACSYLHDVNGVQLLTAESNGVVLEYNKLARNGPVGFDDGHREAWSAHADDNAVIRYNVFEDISNTGYIALVNGAGDAENWHIHGNVFWATGTLDDAGVAALIVTRNDDVHQIVPVGWEIHNNTIANVQGSTNIALDGGRDNRVYDNIWFGNVGNTIGIAGADHDYNWFFGNIRVEDCEPPCNLDASNEEPNGEIGTGDPFVDWQAGDFRLVAATAPGLTLDDAFAVDLLGNVRGEDGVWDRGAYEHAR